MRMGSLIHTVCAAGNMQLCTQSLHMYILTTLDLPFLIVLQLSATCCISQVLQALDGIVHMPAPAFVLAPVLLTLLTTYLPCRLGFLIQWL